MYGDESGHVYNLNKRGRRVGPGLERKLIFLCEQSHLDEQCKARLHVHPNPPYIILSASGQHFHAPIPGKLESMRVKAALRNRATASRDSLTSVSDLVSSSLEGLSEAASARLPNRDSLKRFVRAKRSQLLPPPPTDYTFAVPDFLATILTSAESEERGPFLVGDTLLDGKRLLVVSAPWMLEYANSGAVVEINVDGTFAKAPLLWEQIYVVGTQTSGVGIPLLFCLLGGKSEGWYDKMWEIIAECVPGLKPARATVDFEIAAVNSLRKTFPNIRIQLCAFHLSQSILRKVQQMGFKQRYETDAHFNLCVRMIRSMPFLPVEEVERGWDAFLHSDYCRDPAMDKLAEYYGPTYVYRTDHRGQRKPGLFCVEEWNCFNATLSGQNRTNNASEAFNRRLGSSITEDHPTLWRLLRQLQKELALSRHDLNCALRGDPPSRPSKNSTALQSRLLSIAQTFNPHHDHLIPYIRSIANTLSR